MSESENSWATNYYYEVEFEVWEQLMKELIERQKRQLKRYEMLLAVAKDDLEKEYYTEMIEELKKAILHNEDGLKLARLERDGSIYFIDRDGVPTRIWLGPTLKREHELRKKYSKLLYI